MCELNKIKKIHSLLEENNALKKKNIKLQKKIDKLTDSIIILIDKTS